MNVEKGTVPCTYKKGNKNKRVVQICDEAEGQRKKGEKGLCLDLLGLPLHRSIVLTLQDFTMHPLRICKAAFCFVA